MSEALPPTDASHACQQNGWQTVVRQDGSSFANQGDCVSYGAHGGVLKVKATPPVAPEPVSEPTFGLDANKCSVTVPYTQGIDTVLYGVNGQPETPITHDVTVTGGLDGTDGTAPQFWIGYTARRVTCSPTRVRLRRTSTSTTETPFGTADPYAEPPA